MDYIEESGVNFSNSNSPACNDSFVYLHYSESDQIPPVESNYLLCNYSRPNSTSEQIYQLREFLEALASDSYRFIRTVYAIAYGLIIILSFFGNLLVCKVCLKNMTKTNALIMSLALSDLLVTIFNIPFNYFRIFHFSWPFGSGMCFVVNFVQHLVVYISSYTMAIIAIQRYRSVCGLRLDYESSKITSTTAASGNGCSVVSTTLVRRTNQICSIVVLPFKKLWTCCCRSDCFKSGNPYSMKAIFTAIIITWLSSALIAVLFTYNCMVVKTKNAFGLIIHLSNYSAQENCLNETNNSTNDSYESEKMPELLDYQNRCQNPIPKQVEDFLTRFSIKAYFAKSVIVFITQYFIPLAISCCLYIRIGKIITLQGKLTCIRSKSGFYLFVVDFTF